MKYLDLETLSDFVCTGGDCEFTCCGGWDIFIDEKTEAFYRSVEGEFGEKLKNNIEKVNGKVRFILKEDGRCPFLTEKGLCSIYLTLGEEHLSNTCTYYPRYAFYAGDICFAGVSISCPEVAKFFLTHTDPLRIDFGEDDDPSDAADDTDWVLFNNSVRIFTSLVDIAQNRDLSINERLALIILFLNSFQDCVNKGSDPSALVSLMGDESALSDLLKDSGIYTRDFDSKIAFCTEIMSYFQNVDSIETLLPELSQITEYFRKEENSLTTPKMWIDAYAAENDKEHMIWRENILVYVLFRYFMQGFSNKDFFDTTMLGIDLVFNISTAAFALYHVMTGQPASLDHRRLLIARLSRIIEHNNKFRKTALKHFGEKGMTDPGFLLKLIS